MTLDATGLEVMAHAFASVAEEMGLVLIRSALSPNIRERRDCSAALFDAQGLMIAQAAHIPVHLGAMTESVAAIRRLVPQPGERFILNDPYAGGSHLPDVTIIEAVEIDGVVAGYSAVRAHHSDVGGREPGSMPAVSRMLDEEGIVIPPSRLTAELERRFLAGVRTPEIRRGDLAAQCAAAARGGEGLRALAVRYGAAALADAARDVLAYTARRTRAALERLPARNLSATDWLEGDGIDDRDIPITVRIDIAAGRFRADFAGTATQVRGNVNCPIAVTRSAVLFAVRTMLPEDLPTNAGVEQAIDVVAPVGCLVNARYPAAVAGGNVETSQRIADTVMLALAKGGLPVPAQGQGTMNNITMGSVDHPPPSSARDRPCPPWTYYETIGGGQGASASGSGPSGVHVGMSNTWNTPIEVLEMGLPVRVSTYALRRGSGGRGEWPGGDGVVREYRALEPMVVNVLGERRRHAPAGAAGGLPGAVGRTLVNGQPLPGKARVMLQAGDVLRVETPGGGGWGSDPGTRNADPGTQREHDHGGKQ
ncbi:MAG TPA: hydantoinase B/oxoprolinase family protein [Gemmatimonadales bacterium]|nr:hydantoinase B/oxoprolinase family protein [Gemmatimonadales bacterium]